MLQISYHHIFYQCLSCYIIFIALGYYIVFPRIIMNDSSREISRIPRLRFLTSFLATSCIVGRRMYATRTHDDTSIEFVSWTSIDSLENQIYLLNPFIPKKFHQKFYLRTFKNLVHIFTHISCIFKIFYYYLETVIYAYIIIAQN